MPNTRLVGGMLIWAALLGGVASLAAARSAELGPPTEKVLRYAFHSPAKLERRIEAIDTGDGWGLPARGDPVFAGDARTLIGTIVETRLDQSVGPVDSPAVFATIAIDPEYDPADLEGASWEFGTASGDPAWILDTLLPPAKRAIVVDELTAYVSSHSQEIRVLLAPIEEQVIEHAEEVLEANLTPTVKRHEKEIDALLDRYRGTLKDDLLPVLKAELGPSAKEKAKPLLTKIGRELWDALPMWQGSWAWAKSKIPGLGKDYVDEWWNDFLENKAIPIVKEHEPELVRAGEDLVKEGFKDPKVRAAFNEVMKKLLKDPNFRALARTIIEEALIKPFDPGACWKKIASDPRNKQHFRALQASFAPVMQKIVRLVAVQVRPDGKDGLSPEVARVVRLKVFNKDSRWVSVTTAQPLVPRSSKR